MPATIRYRARQFFQALTARVSDEELREVAQALHPEALSLFRSMAIQDQRHGLDVYHALYQQGRRNPHLLAAALLHDSGKAAAPLPPWQRAVILLLERFAPRLLARLSRGRLCGWRRPFVVHAWHPEIGAHLAEEAGCTPLTVALIRRHQAHPESYRTEEDNLLAALQAADDVN